MDAITFSENPLSPQFCSFCLREKPANVEFDKHIVGCSAELQKCLQSILGDEFRLENFAICKPCWEIMQLIQDFRLRCLKANSLVERIGVGLRSEDGWFSEWSLAKIESIRMLVKNQLLQMEKVEVKAEVTDESEGHQQQKESADMAMGTIQIKSEPDAGDNNAEMVAELDTEGSSASEANNQQLIQNVNNGSADEALEFTIDIGEVKIEPEVEDKEQPSSTQTEKADTEADEALESIIEIGEVKIEPEVEHKVQPSSTQSDKTDTESSEDYSGQNASSSHQYNLKLQQCEKCSRMFKPSGIKLHISLCDGKIPDKMYQCPHCPVSFQQLFKLNSHLNKHTGQKPYQCRTNCKKVFTSSTVRYRHEISCGKRLKNCTLCDKTLDNQVLLNAHYKQEHPGELRFPCSMCDRRYSRKHQLERHVKTHAPGDSAKTFVCKECGKSFIDRNYLNKHMAIHTERKMFQCESCDRQFKLRLSLDIHIALKHPEQASEKGQKCLARMQKRNREVSAKRKLKQGESSKNRRHLKK